MKPASYGQNRPSHLAGRREGPGGILLIYSASFAQRWTFIQKNGLDAVSRSRPETLAASTGPLVARGIIHAEDVGTGSVRKPRLLPILKSRAAATGRCIINSRVSIDAMVQAAHHGGGAREPRDAAAWRRRRDHRHKDAPPLGRGIL